MKILKILLISILVLFPLGQVVRISLVNGVNFLPIDILVLIASFIWLFSSFKKKNLNKSKLFLPLLLFSSVCFISLFVNIFNLSIEHFFVSLLYLLRFIAYASIYFVVREQNIIFKKKFLVGLLLTGFAVVLLGIFQYFLYPDLRNLTYLGWDEHLYRVFSTFLDPNFVGAFFVLEIIVIISLLFSNEYLDKRNFLFLMLAFSLFSLFLTYSRSAYIMFIISSLIFFILHNKKRYILVMFVIFSLGILLIPKNLKSEGVNLLRTASIESRRESQEHAILIIKDHPILGVGFNAYRFAQRKYGFLEQDNWNDIHSGAGVENSFLFVLATTGIIGFISYLFLLGKIIFLGRKALNMDLWSRMMGIILLSSLAGLIVDSLFINSLFYPQIMLWVFVIAGITEKA